MLIPQFGIESYEASCNIDGTVLVSVGSMTTGMTDEQVLFWADSSASALRAYYAGPAFIDR